MAEIVMERFLYHPDGTLGVIRLDEVAGRAADFWTIERPWLDNQPNVSCVPEGSYSLIWRESPRFGWTWMLEDVPDRTYILIHAGNFPRNFQGCIGLGTGLMADRVAVANSRKAVDQFEGLTEGGEWELSIQFSKYGAKPNLQ